jgi:hypothetical protein
MLAQAKDLFPCFGCFILSGMCYTNVVSNCTLQSVRRQEYAIARIALQRNSGIIRDAQVQ